MNFEEKKILDNVSEILIELARQRGVEGFSVKGGALTLEDAMDQEGPLAWALFLHANIISRMAALESMPFECVTDPESLFGNRCGIAPSELGLSFGGPFLDGALEHAVVVGLSDLGCSRQEWEALPPELRVLPVEAYFDDLRANWVCPEFAFGSVAEKVLLWPVLQDFASYDESLELDQSVKPREDLKINRLVPFAPKQ